MFEPEEVDPEFWQGVTQFNQQQFYACHDTLEALWMEAVEPQKSFYQGILQIAVALYHLGNQNLRGATILLGEGMNRLRGYQPICAGLDIAQFLEQSRDLQAALQQFQWASSSHPLPSESASDSVLPDSAPSVALPQDLASIQLRIVSDPNHCAVRVDT